MKFALGQVVITRTALTYAEQHGVDVLAMIARHHNGDWGDLGEHDKALNEESVLKGESILSAYNAGGERWYVVTEWNRSVTTAMLASDY